MLNKSILIQNYHTPATMALVRDFKKIGFTVYSPNNDWGLISYFSPNTDTGGVLMSYEEYSKTKPGYVLITCKPHEEDLKKIARSHGDRMILNIAQQYQSYEPGISDIMICPDITTYETYPSEVAHKLLYFLRPELSCGAAKNVESCFDNKFVNSFISCPQFWANGTRAYNEFKNIYPYECEIFGHQTSGGHLDHEACNVKMLESFFTVHFKDNEAYGMSCIESMMLGTPIMSLNAFMKDKTLGRFFLDSKNSIVVDTVEDLVERVLSITIDEYRLLSKNAVARAYDLTSDCKTSNVLKKLF